MAELYKATPYKPEDKPLESLIGKCQKEEFHFGERLLCHHNFLAVLQIVINADDSVAARTICLKVLLENADFKPQSWRDTSYDIEDKGVISWTNQFVDILNMLLDKGADVGCLSPDTVVREFFTALVHLLSEENCMTDGLMRLFQNFLTEKFLSYTDVRGTLLHALLNGYWSQLDVHLPEEFLNQYHSLVFKVVKAKPGIVDGVDWAGRSSLHYFIGTVKKHKEAFKIASYIVPLLKSDAYINARDITGSTSLHCLMETLFYHPLYEILGDCHHEKMFFELVESLASPSNINMQDCNGHTALHLIARTVLLNPLLGISDFWSIFSSLTTAQNINAMDVDSLTPYSWILRGKERYKKTDTNLERMFEKIEEIFLTSGADLELATSGMPSINRFELVGIIENLKATIHLESKGQRILSLLAENGEEILERDPAILTRMVEKANRLIESTYFLDIMAKIAEAYSKLPNGSLQPLSCLCKHIRIENNDSNPIFLFKHQDKLMSLLKILTSVEHSLDGRTDCLIILLKNVKYSQEKCLSPWLQWNKQFIEVLNLLLDERVNEYWFSRDYAIRCFKMIIHALANETHVAEDMLLLSIKFLKLELCVSYGTSLLHAMMEINWNALPQALPVLKLSERLLKIISHVRPDAVDKTDENGRTPLLCFMNAIKQRMDILIDSINIIRAISETSVDTQDESGNTAVHYLAEALPDNACLDSTEYDGEKIFELFRCLATTTNVAMQNEKGQTVLHTLAKKASCCSVCAQSLLHILSYLTTEKNVNTADNDSITPCSWILKGILLEEKCGADSVTKLKKICVNMLKEGAEVDITIHGIFVIECSEFTKIVTTLNAPMDIHHKAPRILDLLKTSGPGILKANPDIFLQMVEKADMMQESPDYIGIIQEMAEMYKTGILDGRILHDKKSSAGRLQRVLNKLDKIIDKLLFMCEETFLSLIETLLDEDDSESIRAVCFRVLCKHANLSLNEGKTFLYTKRLLATLTLLLSQETDPVEPQSDDVSPVSAPPFDGCSLYYYPYDMHDPDSTLFDFFGSIIHILAQENHLYDVIMDLLSVGLTKKVLDYKARGNGTILHALVKCNWERLPENLPSQVFDQYKRIVCKVVEADQELRNSCFKGCPLQCFIKTINTHRATWRIAHDIVMLLKTETSIKAEYYSDGNVLHCLIEILSKNLYQPVRENSKTFVELISALVSPSNIDDQNRNNCTVLHLLSKAVCICPDLGDNLITVFPLLTSAKNVNATDIDSVTPYSWILLGKLVCEDGKSDSEEMFSKIENILLRNGADAELAKAGMAAAWSQELAEIITNIKEVADLDQWGRRILDLLKEGGKLKRNPDVFEEILKQAYHLIKSPYYVEIIQQLSKMQVCQYQYKFHEKMLQEYHYPYKFHNNILRRLQGPWNGLGFTFFQDFQNDIMTLIRILATVYCSVDFRSECFRSLLLDAAYVGQPYAQCVLHWTDNLLSTLEYLLKEGADPAWVPQYSAEDGCFPHMDSAQYSFFQSLIHILANENHFNSSVMEFALLLVHEKSAKYTRNEETLLHALMSVEWVWLSKETPNDVFEKYKIVVHRVIEANPAAVNQVDHQKKTPLQCLMSGIKGRIDILGKLTDVTEVLISRTNHHWKYLRECNPLVNLFEALAFNACQKVDEDIKTCIKVIESLAISSYSLNEVQNRQKGTSTVLHELIKTVFHHPNLGEPLLGTFSILATRKSVNTILGFSITPFSWVLRGKLVGASFDTDMVKTFSKIEEIFLKNGADVELAKSGLVATLILWIQNQFLDVSCSVDELRKLLHHMNTITEWNSSAYSWVQPLCLYENANSICNPQFIPVIVEIMKLLARNENLACNAWRSFVQYLPIDGVSISVTSMVILLVLLECGAMPGEGDVRGLLRLPQDFTRNEELLTAFLKVLIKVCHMKGFKCDLDFLTECYFISDLVQQLAQKLVHLHYKTLKNCCQSEILTNILLFMSYEFEVRPLSDEHYAAIGRRLETILLENPLPSNWLERNPLHLAAIFLQNESSWKCLPKEVVQRNLNSRDIHGCTPLHVAHLHHNEAALHFLMSHGAMQDVIDYFGYTPVELGTRCRVTSRHGSLQTVNYDDCEEHIDVKHHQLCCNIMEAKSGIFELMRPMLVIQEEEAEALHVELRTLFERIMRETQFSDYEIVIAGSMRERLKVGLLDEADVQIRFQHIVSELEEKKYESLGNNLKNSLTKINWKGIHLRPVSIRSPWKFIRETGGYCGMTLSVDVVFISMSPIDEYSYISAKQKSIFKGAPEHKIMRYYLVGRRHKRSEVVYSRFKECQFAFEWDIIDSLPTSCRLGIALAKALVRAYDLSTSDRSVQIPITSYMIKTALFYLLDDNCIVGPIADAIQKVSENEGSNTKRGVQNNEMSKLKYHPRPKWLTDEDIDQHGEEARVWARKIFGLIKILSQERWKLKTFWHKPPEIGKHKWGYGEAEYICNICDSLLERLNEN